MWAENTKGFPNNEDHCGCAVDIPPGAVDAHKSMGELNAEVDLLIDLAAKGNKEAAKRAMRLSRQILRRQGVER